MEEYSGTEESHVRFKETDKMAHLLYNGSLLLTVLTPNGRDHTVQRVAKLSAVNLNFVFRFVYQILHKPVRGALKGS